MAAWQFQVRFTASAELAERLRDDASGGAMPALRDVLQRHNASLICQYDAFANYVSEAERLGVDGFPLYRWTRDTLDNPAKRAKFMQSFTVYVNGDEVYPQAAADPLEADLLALVGDSGIERVTKYDTNPANNPQPPAAR